MTEDSYGNKLSFEKNDDDAALGHEDLLGNSVMDIGSNMLLLGHPDVKGLRVRKNAEHNRVEVDIYVLKLTDSLQALVHDECRGSIVNYYNSTTGLDIAVSFN